MNPSIEEPPHIQLLSTSLFLTFRLAGSLPDQVLARIAEERRLLQGALKGETSKSRPRFRELARSHFAGLESWLDKATTGPTWLADACIADLVAGGTALSRRKGLPTGRVFNYAESTTYCFRAVNSKTIYLSLSHQ